MSHAHAPALCLSGCPEFFLAPFLHMRVKPGGLIGSTTPRNCTTCMQGVCTHAPCACTSAAPLGKPTS